MQVHDDLVQRSPTAVAWAGSSQLRGVLDIVPRVAGSVCQHSLSGQGLPSICQVDRVVGKIATARPLISAKSFCLGRRFRAAGRARRWEAQEGSHRGRLAAASLAPGTVLHAGDYCDTHPV